MVMPGHVIYSNIDPENPLHIAGPSFTTCLDGAGLGGLVVTDDLADPVMMSTVGGTRCDQLF